MSVVLHPRAVRGNRLQLWIGVFGATAAPTLRWLLDGADAMPVPIRTLIDARPTPAMADVNEPRAFTGVYEFQQNIRPATSYKVQVCADSTWSEIVYVRSLPAAVPSGGSDAFNVLLASCFYRGEDRGGFAGAEVKQLMGLEQPDLTLLTGDQVYLDQPLLRNFRMNKRSLAEKFEKDYTENWRGPGGYADILAAAPSASIPDDHEYWNNFPHPNLVALQSIVPVPYDNWQQAAHTMYEAFQLSEPGRYDPLLVIDVPPLSFFLMDNRTFRDRDRRFTVTPEGLEQFTTWAADVAARQHFGVVVTGQSLIEGSAGLKGAVADRSMVDYSDYPAIMNTIIRLARAGRPVLCLTGDVHFGRVVEATEVGNPTAKIYEIISSPTSLLTVPVFDNIKHLFKGRRDPWYRFRAAEPPPGEIDYPGRIASLSTSMTYPDAGQKGNHVAHLAFRTSGFGLTLTITYRMIAQQGAPARVVELKPISLSPTV